MKKVIGSLILAFSLTALTAFAAEVTIKGQSECGKCTLKKTSGCQNAIKVKEGDKEVIYLMTKNKVHKQTHGKYFCKGGKTVTVKGVVTEKDGQKIITATEVKGE